MKKIIMLALITLYFANTNAQSWLWGRQGVGGAEGFSVATNTTGKVGLTGYFTDTLVFDSIILHSGTNRSIFLSNYYSTGKINWAIQSTSKVGLNEQANSICLDKLGNIFMAGQVEDTVEFGAFTLTSQSLPQVFIAKIDSEGNVKWAEQSGGFFNSSGSGLAITADDFGNEYVTGSFQDTINIGSFTLITPPGIGNVFLTKLTSAGNVLWAKQGIVYTGYIAGYGIASDKSQNIYVTGIFSDSISFGSTTLTTKAGDYDAFLVKYDLNGNVKWAKQPQVDPANKYTYGYSVVADKSGNIYITGAFKDTIYFDAIKLFSQEQDIFLAKYDSSGNLIWAKAAEVLDGDRWIGYSLASDDSNYIYLSSGKNYSNPAYLKFGNLSFNIVDSKDASVLIKFDSAGNAICGSIISSGGDDNNSVAVAPSGQYLYLGGDLEEDTVIFGPDTLRIPIPTEYPFVARWQVHNEFEVVNELSNSKNVIIYPNPNAGVINILSRNITTKSLILIYNTFGKEIYKGILNPSNAKIHLSEPNGLYLLRITDISGNLIYSGSFIILSSN